MILAYLIPTTIAYIGLALIIAIFFTRNGE